MDIEGQEVRLLAEDYFNSFKQIFEISFIHRGLTFLEILIRFEFCLHASVETERALDSLSHKIEVRHIIRHHIQGHWEDLINYQGQEFILLITWVA